MSTQIEPNPTITIKRYRDDPNYGQGPDRLRNRVDWVRTMYANLPTEEQRREFMVRLISMIECDISDTSFEKRVLDVLKQMQQREAA